MAKSLNIGSKDAQATCMQGLPKTRDLQDIGAHAMEQENGMRAGFESQTFTFNVFIHE